MAPIRAKCMATGPVTQLLAAAGRGEPGAHERLWNAIYEELHTVARRQMALEPPGWTLQPTALIHEAYLRLFGKDAEGWANRQHFFAAAARSMRQIRVDYARKRNSAKRAVGARAQGGNDDRVSFDDDPTEILAIDEALKHLEAERPRLAEVVVLRFFAGLTIDEAAEALEVSPRTVDADWRLAKAWLHRALTPD